MAKRKKISLHGYENSGTKIEQSQEDEFRKELFDTLKMWHRSSHHSLQRGRR